MHASCARCGNPTDASSSLRLAEGPVCLPCADRDALATAQRLHAHHADRRGAWCLSAAVMGAVACATQVWALAVILQLLALRWGWVALGTGRPLARAGALTGGATTLFAWIFAAYRAID